MRKKRDPSQPTSRRPTEVTLECIDDDDRAPPGQASGGRSSAKAAGKGKGGAGSVEPMADREALASSRRKSTADADDDHEAGDDEDQDADDQDDDADDQDDDDDDDQDADDDDQDDDADDRDDDDADDQDDDADDQDDDDDDDQDADDQYEHRKDAAAAKGPRRVEPWRLSKLRPHPKQAQIFGDVPEPELAALTASMRKDGLRDPVEILPDGTILAGHQRWLAAKRLGWKEIDVVVRHALADDDEAADTYMIDSNLLRRQLSLLGRARCLQRLVEIESRCAINELEPSRKEEVKAKIGKRMGLTMRSVNRYLAVLHTPREVQTAFDEGAISLVTAGKVAQLQRPQQQAIAKRIAEGEPAKKVVAEALRGETGAADSVNASWRRVRRTVSREMPKLSGHVAEINPKQLAYWCGQIRDMVALLGEMVVVGEAHSGAGTAPPAADRQAATTTKSRKGLSAPRGSRKAGKR
jgi:ParB/RepB/Spo0J family partition protein